MLPLGGRLAIRSTLQYLDCPRCRARFHTGPIYERLTACPRCGASFDPPPPRLRERLRTRFGGRGVEELPDWETITGSQYAARVYVTRTRTGTPTNPQPRPGRRRTDRRQTAEGPEPESAPESPAVLDQH
jgi:hypothetical protein